MWFTFSSDVDNWACVSLQCTTGRLLKKVNNCHAHLLSHRATVPCHLWHESVIEAFNTDFEKCFFSRFNTLPGSLQESLEGRLERLHLRRLLFRWLGQGHLLRYDKLIVFHMPGNKTPGPPSSAGTLSSCLAEQPGWKKAVALSHCYHQSALAPP